MERRFSSIVIAMDLEHVAADPVIFVAGLTGATGLRTEIVTEVPRASTEVGARATLDRRIALARLARATCFVLPADAPPGRAIAEHVANRAGVLVVTAATTWGSLGRTCSTQWPSSFWTSSAPVLVLGPNFAPSRTLAVTTVIVVVDGSDVADSSMPVVEAWVRTFPGAVVRVVEVLPVAPIPACDTDRHVQRYVNQLAEHGIAASGDVLRGGQPASMLVTRADEVSAALLVVPSPRWSGQPSHWFSTTRRIVHPSTQPVLVVSAEPWLCGAVGLDPVHRAPSRRLR